MLHLAQLPPNLEHRSRAFTSTSEHYQEAQYLMADPFCPCRPPEAVSRQASLVEKAAIRNNKEAIFASLWPDAVGGRLCRC
jgi:hypothetical protein